MIKLNHLIRKDIIYEGLIHTVNIDTTADMLEKWSGSEGKFIIKEKPKKLQINFLHNLDESELKHLLELINNLGWFVSSILVSEPEMKWKKFNYNDFIKNDFNRKWASFQLEPKFDIELNIYDYNIVYHVSPSINKDKILRIGLVPKSKGKMMSHPDRIYLSDNIEDIVSITFQFQKMYPDIEFSLFEIDFKEVRKNNPSIRLFDDPNFEGGFFTLSNIPPQFISEIEQHE